MKIFGRKGLDKRAGSEADNGLSDQERIRRSFLFRPGDFLSDQQLSMFPSDVLIYEFEGYRSIGGGSWKGASVELTPENRIECVNLHDSPTGYGGLTLGMSASEAEAKYPSLAIVLTRYDDKPADERMVFYCAPLPQEGFELLITTRGDRVVRIGLAHIGYWQDPEREARNERRSAKIMDHAAAERKRIEEWKSRNETQTTIRSRWKSIADPDAMLDIWCETASSEKNKLVALLRSSPPSEWNGIADQFNFDDGLAPLFWIVRQARAELDTIFYIYVMCEPDYFCDPTHRKHPVDMGELSLIEEIKTRVDTGFYHLLEDFDGISAWDRAPLGKRDAPYMSPYRDTFRRYFARWS